MLSVKQPFLAIIKSTLLQFVIGTNHSPLYPLSITPAPYLIPLEPVEPLSSICA